MTTTITLPHTFVSSSKPRYTKSEPFVNPIKAALAHMESGDTVQAEKVLKSAFDKNTNRIELARIANMINPCGMYFEALDALRRIDGGIEEYKANKPEDE